MSFGEFINKLNELEGIINTSELLREKATVLRKEWAIKSLKDFQSEQDELEKENRLLRIGILGKVKAGKSSFLNALLFNGESILPEAATPMTAALSVLEYAKTPSLSVEFYSQEDLGEIKEKAKQYEKMLKEQEKQEFERLKELELKKVQNKAQIDEAKLRANAQILATKKLKQELEELCACYEQNARIKTSALNLSELEKHKEFQGSLSEIQAKLKDYVGSEGKFMPFTKSITLRLDNEFLKDVQIIDAPGLNDPVPSRSVRTIEFLDKCDGVIVLLQASQLLSQSDTLLLDRLTNKGSTARLFFVASKADDALMGDEYKGDLNSSFIKLENALNSQLESVLKAQLNTQKDILQRALREQIIISSCISLCICSNLAKNKELSSNQKTIFDNLKEQFADDFKGANCSQNLQKLANMPKIRVVFDNLRQEKEQIFAQRLKEDLGVKNANLGHYKEALLKVVSEQKELLQNADMQQLKEQANNLKTAKEKGEFALDEAWEMLSLDITKKIREILQLKKEQFFTSIQGKAEKAQGTETESWEVSDSVWYNPFSWGRTKTITDTHTTVKAGIVRAAIIEVCDDLEDLLNRESKDLIMSWRKECVEGLLQALRSKVDDEFIDDIALLKAVKESLMMIDYPQIAYSKIPDKIKGASGTLKDWEADEFIEVVSNFVSNFQSQVRRDINAFADELEDTFNGVKIGESVFKKLISELTRLESDLKNKAARLDEYKNLERKLQDA